MASSENWEIFHPFIDLCRLKYSPASIKMVRAGNKRTFHEK